MTQNHDPYHDAAELAGLTLGKATEYQATYDASLLQAVPRKLNRDAIGLTQELPFTGADIWTGYELSWLNAKGKPIVAIAEFTLDFSTKNLVESKSFKLYLNSFNQTKFDSVEAVQQTLTADLSQCAQGTVTVKIIEVKHFATMRIAELPGHLLDDLDIEVDNYQFNADLLLDSTDEKQVVAETLTSNLLKSNCLIPLNLIGGVS